MMSISSLASHRLLTIMITNDNKIGAFLEWNTPDKYLLLTTAIGVEVVCCFGELFNSNTNMDFYGLFKIHVILRATRD